MVIFKVKYSCIHSDNYQGASGKVIIKSDYIHIEDDAKISTALDICKRYLAGITKQENYPVENPSLISIELIESK